MAAKKKSSKVSKKVSGKKASVAVAPKSAAVSAKKQVSSVSVPDGKFSRWVIFLLRITTGFTFLWAFLDKTFGLGFSTKAASSWLHGGSPTSGFLLHSTHGPFAAFFQSLAGNPLVDWLFMLGLLFIGTTLILGLSMRLAAWSGFVMVLLMWLAEFPPTTNPIMDYHVSYALVLLTLMIIGAQYVCGLGKWWENTELVRKMPWLR